MQNVFFGVGAKWVGVMMGGGNLRQGQKAAKPMKAKLNVKMIRKDLGKNTRNPKQQLAVII